MANEFIARNGITSLGNIVVSGSITSTGAINISGSIASASFAATASSADNLLVRSTLTAQTLVVQTITSSVDFVTGSTRFGSIIGNTHQFTGSVSMSGSLGLVGALSGTSATFSAVLTAASTAQFNNGVLLKDGATSIASGYFAISSLNSTTLGFKASGGRGFDMVLPSSGGQITIPNGSGTLALTSDIPSLSGYVQGTGTTNYLPKFTGASTIGNSIVSESGSALNVAGTITASGRITINGNNDLAFYGASSSTGYMHLQLANTGNTTRLAQEGSTGGNMAVGSSAYATILNSTGAYSLQLATNNNVRATLDTSGNLGLGVTPSAWNSSFRAIQVGVGGSFWASNISTLPYAYMSSNQLYDAGNTNRYIIDGFATWYIQEQGTHKWMNAPSGTAGNAISFTQAMTLTAAGNLLIGKTNDVGGPLQVSNGSNMLNFSWDVNGAYLSSVNNANTVYKGFQFDASSYTFLTNATPKMTITSGGNVLIGTTDTTFPFKVAKTASGWQGQFANGTSAVYLSHGEGYGAYIDSGTLGSSSSRYILTCASGGSDRFIIRGDGYIFSMPTYNNTFASAANMYVNTDGSFGRATSSLKYKKNVQNYTKGLNELMQLRPVTYESKNELEDGQQFAGLIAEEVNSIGLTEFVQYAEDGTPDALAYTHMIALAVKAIQELKAENDSLKSRIEALENK